MYKLSDFYKHRCGCVRYTNRHTTAVKKGYELLGAWRVEQCSKHASQGLSNYEKSLQETYRKLKEEVDNV